MLGTSLGRFRLLGYLEGCSFIALLFIAMPLKYKYDMPMAVTYVGMAHGLLWILYIGGLMAMYLSRGWSVMLLLGGIVASVLPFGPFVYDRYLPKEEPSA